MYCNKSHVNTLTALLLAHGIEDAVVCPGSRNAIIVHNLLECQAIRLHPVTDERSASFVAIGLWLKTRKPIVVCVTSGSALLNTLPGVAEASYRHIPLVIISADRPEEWIGQLDGQTLPQPGALLPYAKSWQLPENNPQHTNRLVNEAIMALQHNGGQPVHINVPITEPLFDFTVDKLPNERVICCTKTENRQPLPEHILTQVLQAQRPLIVFGQYEDTRIPALEALKNAGVLVYAENISNQAAADTLDVPTETPDIVLHFGGALVEKQLKLWLRTQNVPVIRIDETDEAPDTFCNLSAKVKGTADTVLQQIALGKGLTVTSLSKEKHDWEAFFVGNSTAVRWANRHIMDLADATYCNRGTNGIEGSLSVAAGYSLSTERPVLCLLGDLSFFYDCNALWNQHLRGNLRILLVNNQKGGIFYKLPGLPASPALNEFVAASHTNTAEGIALSYHCTYLKATTRNLENDFGQLLQRLADIPSERPVLFEVFV